MLTMTRIAIALCGLLATQSCAAAGAERSTAANPARSVVGRPGNPNTPATPTTPVTPADLAEVATKSDGRPNKDCWWHRLGANDLVAVWVSPRLAGEVQGGFRLLNLFFHDPTCVRPMALFGSVARLNRADPVSISNASLEFTVAPVAGKTWAEVVVRQDLKVTLSRR